MTIETRTTGDLLYLLQRQYPDGVTTFAPCPICGTGSRGGGYCAKCICSELTRRGVHPRLVDGLHSLLDRRRDMNQQIAAATEAIQEQADEMQQWTTTVEDTTPNVELRGAERDGEAGMRSVPLDRRVGPRPEAVLGDTTGHDGRTARGI